MSLSVIVVVVIVTVTISVRKSRHTCNNVLHRWVWALILPAPRTPDSPRPKSALPWINMAEGSAIRLLLSFKHQRSMQACFGHSV
jgi:hypothetical protein